MTIPLYGITVPDVKKELAGFGIPDWRIKQVLDGLYRSRAFDFKNITTLPKDIKAILIQRSSFFTLGEEKRSVSSSEDTVKFVLKLADGLAIECVSLPNTKDEYTFCISTQAGCRLACAFCASGLGGCDRDLEAHEIVEQAMWMEKSGFHATNIVFIGMGEPLLNWDNVAAAIGIINDAEGMNIGSRNITVSTAGIVEGIKKISELGLQVRLSVSLHFPWNDVRSRWMPVNRSNPLPELLASLKEYQEKTGRQITFEYILFDGLNDHYQAADDLRKLCDGLRYKVNLIPYNKVEGLEFKPPKPGKAEKFRDYLVKKGVNAIIRRKRGSDIDAACGQLRRSIKT